MVDFVLFWRLDNTFLMDNILHTFNRLKYDKNKKKLVIISQQTKKVFPNFIKRYFKEIDSAHRVMVTTVVNPDDLIPPNILSKTNKPNTYWVELKDNLFYSQDFLIELEKIMVKNEPLNSKNGVYVGSSRGKKSFSQLKGGLTDNGVDTINNIKDKEDHKLYPEFQIAVEDGEITIYPFNPSHFSENEMIVNDGYNKKMVLDRIGIIADTFTLSTFDNFFDLQIISPTNYKKELNGIRLLFIESSWNGCDGLWKGKITGRMERMVSREYYRLLDYCKQNKIKTVFWNKEDPVHFDDFKHAAKRCDLIFTSCESTIGRYEELSQKKNVYPMSFFINPFIHNPLTTFDKIANTKLDVAFAGSWYDTKERQDNTKILFDGVIKTGRELVVFDRRSSDSILKQLNGYENYVRFPGKYNPYIYKGVPYSQILEYYKRFRVFLNVNTVSNSNHMFSRRVYELLGCATHIISSKGLGMKKMFGEYMDVIETVDDVSSAVNRIFSPDHLKDNFEMRIEGWRDVMLNHTILNRMEYVYSKLGMELKIPTIKVLVITTNNNINNNMFYLKGNRIQLVFRKADDIMVDSIYGVLKDVPNVDFIVFGDSKVMDDEYYIFDRINLLSYNQLDVGGVRYTNNIESKFRIEERIKIKMIGSVIDPTVVDRIESIKDDVITFNSHLQILNY